MARESKPNTAPRSKSTTRNASESMILHSKPPRSQVLLISCMDLRLLDDIVAFMNEMNLQNRYDHLALAGASMGATQLKWESIFLVHLDSAIEKLNREIKDIFILEHLDCGAYKKLHPNANVSNRYKKCADEFDMSGMKRIHRDEAQSFADRIETHVQAKEASWAARWSNTHKDNPWTGIRVHCLVMDLLGNVTEL